MFEASYPQVEKFREIYQKFSSEITLPPKDSWKTKTDDDIWMRVVSQVVVVGNSAPSQKLKNPIIHAQLRWETLCALDEKTVSENIWEALRSTGTRYTGKTATECPKTKSLSSNFKFLKQFSGGPRGFIQHISEIESADEKLVWVSKNLSYIKNKGARDFLTSGFGLVNDRIALDVRVMTILHRIIGESIPKKTPQGANDYEALEHAVINQICKPIGITGAELDQLLYQKYDQILEML